MDSYDRDDTCEDEENNNPFKSSTRGFWRNMENTVSTMDRTAYARLLAGLTMAGVVFSALIALSTLRLELNWGILLVCGLGLPLLGAFIAAQSRHPLVSGLGFVLISGGFGVLLGPTIASAGLDIALTASILTFGIAAIMSLVGIIYPKSLEHWGMYLGACLLALIGLRLVQIFILPLFGVMPLEGIWWQYLIEFGAAALFCCYIVYDWNRALRLPYTADNAVDAAIAVYLDILNLFLIILRILSMMKKR